MTQLDPQNLAQLQLERLQSSLNRAYRYVPFHQHRFEQSGIEPSQISDTQDLARLAFMERKHLGQHYPYGLFAVPLRDIVRIHTAPGTTLNPTVSGYTKQDVLHWQEMIVRALAAANVTAHDIMQISLEAGLSNWGRDYKQGAETIEASVIPYTPLSLAKQLMVLRDYKTSVLITTPSSAAQLVGHMFKVQMNPTHLNLRTLILVGEPAERQLRHQLEEKLHVTSWVHYGLSEVPGPAVAFECKQHAGLHVNEDHFLPEIVDPDNSQVLPAGQTGELILTTLTTRAYPLIRFRTGDRARIISEPCPCGLTLKLIEWLPERADDMLVIRGVKVLQRQARLHIEQALDSLPARLRCFKQAEDTEHRLEVWLGVDEQLFSDEIKELQQRIQLVQARLEENLGVPVQIRLKETSSFN